jgi:hypothetical protein
MRRRVYIGLLSAFLLLTCLSSIVFFLGQRRRETQALAEYYAAILEDAPCIGSVCPGFDEGRAKALESLQGAESVQAKLQGTDLIHLLFMRDEDEIVNYGVIYFENDADGIPRVGRIEMVVEGVTLDLALNTLGEPEKYLFISGCGMGARVHAKLLYLERGVEIAVEYAARRPGRQMLTGETPVSAIEYYEPENLHGHLSESLDWYILDTVAYDLDPSVTKDDFISEIRPWPGIDAQPTPSADFCPR